MLSSEMVACRSLIRASKFDAAADARSSVALTYLLRSAPELKPPGSSSSVRRPSSVVVVASSSSVDILVFCDVLFVLSLISSRNGREGIVPAVPKMASVVKKAQQQQQQQAAIDDAKKAKASSTAAAAAADDDDSDDDDDDSSSSIGEIG
jgi:hypothetical protein